MRIAMRVIELVPKRSLSSNIGSPIRSGRAARSAADPNLPQGGPYRSSFGLASRECLLRGSPAVLYARSPRPLILGNPREARRDEPAESGHERLPQRVDLSFNSAVRLGAVCNRLDLLRSLRCRQFSQQDHSGARPTVLSRSLSFDRRRRPETFRTAIATALFWPTSTTSFLPRVMPM